MYNETNLNLSRELRHKGTYAERVMWLKLRNNQVAAIKFRRQQSIGNYIADFVSFEKKLIIEIDGGQHSEERITGKDKQRTEWLDSQGFRVIRFWNNEALENLEGVMHSIREAPGIQAPSPSP
jgi:very-short-patch-repair endonuclease